MKAWRRSIAVGSVALVTILGQFAASAASNWLEPEEGTFAGAGSGSLSPSDLLLRLALFQDDAYRMCLLVEMPSLVGSPTAVYIRETEGHAVVISRRAKEEPLADMLHKVEERAKKKSISIDAGLETIPVEQIRSAVDTKTADLDRDTAHAVMDACREVLLQARYVREPTRGNDGTMYHAGHWIPGTFLAGQTWSPKPGTVAREFVEMETALRDYAESSAAKRAAAKANLLGRAKGLLRRVESAAPTAPANPALNPTGLRPAG
jgi:hypothetical protein